MLPDAARREFSIHYTLAKQVVNLIMHNIYIRWCSPAAAAAQGRQGRISLV